MLARDEGGFRPHRAAALPAAAAVMPAVKKRELVVAQFAGSSVRGPG